VQANKKDVLNRLATIDGHLKGIRKMIDDDQYCVDILRQTYAVERALKKLEGVLLDGHLNGCVRERLLPEQGEETIEELSELFGVARR